MRIKHMPRDLEERVKAAFHYDWHPDQGRLVIYGTKWGTVTYYPKSKKLLHNRKNKWHPYGEWVLGKLLEEAATA